MKMTRIAFALGSLLCLAAAPARAADKTERTWSAKCASCHGDKGKGDTKKGQEMKIADMSTAAFQKEGDDKLKKAIEDGVNTTKDGVKQEMDGYKDKLKPEEVDALVKYIRGFAAK
jgi:mono/diheme cytochrome c family protein